MTPTLQTTTQAVDTAFYVIFGISGIMLLGIAIAMVWFVWRYNRKRQPVPLSQKDHNLWLEVIWTIIPTALVMLMFWYGWEGYLSLRRIPDDALEIKATARMWSWLFTYGNGRHADKLYVPVGRPVKIRLEAVDVLHSFYVPAFRVKRDMVPGMTNWVWFVAEKPGSYDLFCAEYCGVGHSKMVTTVEALPGAEFRAWLEAAPAADPGKELLSKYGCLGCHSLDGARLVGPSFQGIAGRQVTLSVAGALQTVKTDRAYLKESILDPERAIVSGYPPAMPSFKGQLADTELDVMLDYLLTLTAVAGPLPVATPPATAPNSKVEEEVSGEHREPASRKEQEEAPPGKTTSTPAARGAALAETLGCLGCHSIDGSSGVGPSLKGVFGQPREVTRGGGTATVTADVAYLERAIRDPGAEVVVGYPPAMPPFAQLGDDQVHSLVTWLETLK